MLFKKGLSFGEIENIRNEKHYTKTYCITRETDFFEVLYNDLKAVNECILYPITENSDSEKIFFIDLRNRNFADTIIRNYCKNIIEIEYKKIHIAEV